MTTIACLSPYTEDQVYDLAGTDQLQVRLLPAPPATAALRAAVAGADLVIGDVLHRHHLDRDVLSLMRGCRLIQQPSVGFDEIDHRAAAEIGIPVANTGGHNSEAVADWVVMGMLNLLRSGPSQDRDMHRGGWPDTVPRGRELGSLTVGIVGMGRVGRGVARRLSAFGSSLLYTDVMAPDGMAGAERVPLPELLGRSDVVTLHVPLGDGTRHLIGSGELAAMQTGALLVNASRGPIVDESALAAALDSGRLGGAALDVFETEPTPASSSLRSMDNVFLTPHTAARTEESAVRLREAVAANLRRVLAGQRPLFVINGVAAAQT